VRPPRPPPEFPDAPAAAQLRTRLVIRLTDRRRMRYDL
jgi:hypothetical protein